MVHFVSGYTRGVQVKQRSRAIPERLTTRRYTNPRLPYLTFSRHRQTAMGFTH